MPGAALRPDLFLLARLLERLAEAPEGLRPTQLQLAGGINYTQLERYVDYLAEHGLVESADGDGSGSRLYLTPKGVEALGYLARTIRDLLREGWGPRRDPG